MPRAVYDLTDVIMNAITPVTEGTLWPVTRDARGSRSRQYASSLFWHSGRVKRVEVPKIPGRAGTHVGWDKIGRPSDDPAQPWDPPGEVGDRK